MRALLLLAAVALTAIAQPDTSGWIPAGPGATLRADPGALALTYQIAPGRFSGAALPLPGGLADMQRIRFRIRTDHDTAIAVLLKEKQPGGDYSAVFWAPANAWQQIELTPADFSLNTGPKDPADADGKLDLDRVEAIAIFDLANFFAALPESPNFPVTVSRSSGAHTLLLAAFQALSTAAPARRTAEKTIPIDAFDRGFLEWITLGGISLRLSAQRNPLGTPALEASYEQTEGRFSILVRRLSNFDLSKAKRIQFDVASEREITLAISFELTNPAANDGPRYTLTIFPPAHREVFHVSLSLADFERDPNASVPGPPTLDPSRLKSIAITDVSAAAGGDIGANSIWIGKLQATTN